MRPQGSGPSHNWWSRIASLLSPKALLAQSLLVSTCTAVVPKCQSGCLVLHVREFSLYSLLLQEWASIGTEECLISCCPVFSFGIRSPDALWYPLTPTLSWTSPCVSPNISCLSPLHHRLGWAGPCFRIIKMKESECMAQHISGGALAVTEMHTEGLRTPMHGKPSMVDTSAAWDKMWGRHESSVDRYSSSQRKEASGNPKSHASVLHCSVFITPCLEKPVP